MTIDLSSSKTHQWEFLPEGGHWQSILVPHGGWRAQGHTCDAGTYRIWLTIPREAKDKVVRLAFEAVNFGAKVFAGADEDHLEFITEHVNGWMPFTADLTSVAVAGRRICVQVEVSGRAKLMVNGQYTVPQGGTWFEGLADGILRGVHLEVRPKIFIENIFVKTSVQHRHIRVVATVQNETGSIAEVTASLALGAAGKGKNLPYPKLAPATLSLAPGENRDILLAMAPWDLGAESYWWPNVPFDPNFRSVLHEATLSLRQGRRQLDTATQRFGFREFRTVGNTYELNGVRCNLRGDNQQEANFGTDAYGVDPGFGKPTPGNAGWPGAVDNLLRANFNVLRLHQVPGTPYMLDVCDERGLMVVDETPIRGSENKENKIHGRAAMLRSAAELTLRDRNHPSIIIWSAANELFWPGSVDKDEELGRQLARDLQRSVLSVDDTRVVIFDGLKDVGPDIINMEHYRGGLGNFPLGGTPRSDRPYGETECIWPIDNSLLGFAWMGTATRERRLTGNSDIRNYVLNNAWPNYVPGHSRKRQLLEKKIKNMNRAQSAPGGMEILPDIPNTWTHRLIKLMQQSFHPVPVWDVEFETANKFSNANGDWPSVVPLLPAGAMISRQLVVGNDEFSGAEVEVEYEFRWKGKRGKPLDTGRFVEKVPFGEFRRRHVMFITPKTGGTIQLILRTRKNGQIRYEEKNIFFAVEDRIN